VEKKRFCKKCANWDGPFIRLCDLKVYTGEEVLDPITGHKELKENRDENIAELCKTVLGVPDVVIRGGIVYKIGTESILPAYDNPSVTLHAILNRDNKCEFYKPRLMSDVIFIISIILAFLVAFLFFNS